MKIILPLGILNRKNSCVLIKEKVNFLNMEKQISLPFAIV